MAGILVQHGVAEAIEMINALRKWIVWSRTGGIIIRDPTNKEFLQGEAKSLIMPGFNKKGIAAKSAFT